VRDNTAKCLAGVCSFGILLWGCSTPNTLSDTSSQNTADITDVFQSRILEDGVVTHAEYEQAVIAYLTCVEDAGLPAQGPVWDERNSTFYFTIMVHTGSKIDHAEFDMDQCLQLHLEEVSKKWYEQNIPTTEERFEMFNDYKACLLSEGIEEVRNMNDSIRIMETLENLGGDEYMMLCSDFNPDVRIIDVGPLPEFNGPGAG